jgi:protein ImuA
MTGAAKPDLCTLRARIQTLEKGHLGGRFLPLGLAPLDAALPGGGLALGALHEIMGAGPDEEDGAVPAAFAASLLARLPGGATGGLVLWCMQADDLYAPGLAANALAPERLIVARCREDAETLWAMEEGLRSAVPVAVLGELATLSPTAGRRLQLACEASGVTALVLRRWREGGVAARQRAAPSAAVTRWRVAAAPSRDIGDAPGGPRVPSGIGTPLWRLELLRCRGGAPGSWLVSAGLTDIEGKEDRDAADHVALAAGLADRPAAARRARAG